MGCGKKRRQKRNYHHEQQPRIQQYQHERRRRGTGRPQLRRRRPPQLGSPPPGRPLLRPSLPPGAEEGHQQEGGCQARCDEEDRHCSARVQQGADRPRHAARQGWRDHGQARLTGCRTRFADSSPERLRRKWDWPSRARAASPATGHTGSPAGRFTVVPMPLACEGWRRSSFMAGSPKEWGSNRNP